MLARDSAKMLTWLPLWSGVQWCIAMWNQQFQQMLLKLEVGRTISEGGNGACERPRQNHIWSGKSPRLQPRINTSRRESGKPFLLLDPPLLFYWKSLELGPAPETTKLTWVFSTNWYVTKAVPVNCNLHKRFLLINKQQYKLRVNGCVGSR